MSVGLFKQDAAINLHQQRVKPRSHYLWILLLSIVAQVVFLALLPRAYRTGESPDYTTFYGPMAQHIVDGKGFVFNGKVPDRYPPGYPVYVAAHLYAAKRLNLDPFKLITATNILVMALSCLLIFRIAESIFTARIGLLAAFLWATYPFALWLIPEPSTEVPFILVFTLLVWLFVRNLEALNPMNSAVVGLLTGIAALIRPVALFVPLVLAAITLARRGFGLRHRLMCAALIAGAFVVAIAPWETAVRVHDHRWILLSSGGSHGMLDGLTFPRNFDRGRRGHAAIPAEVVALAQHIQASRGSLETTGDVVRFMFGELLRDPVPTLEMGILKIVRSWYATDSMQHEAPAALLQIFYLLLIVPGAWLAWGRFPEKRLAVALLLSLALYFWAITTSVLSILRYMVPVMGLVLIFAAVGLDRIRLFHWKSRTISSDATMHELEPSGVALHASGSERILPSKQNTDRMIIAERNVL